MLAYVSVLVLALVVPTSAVIAPTIEAGPGGVVVQLEQGSVLSVQTVDSNGSVVDIAQVATLKDIPTIPDIDLADMLSRLSALEASDKAQKSTIDSLQSQVAELKKAQAESTAAVSSNADAIADATEEMLTKEMLTGMVTAESLPGTVQSIVNTEMHRTVITHTWSAHGPQSTPDSTPRTSRYIGRLHSSEVLTVDVSDVGCNSGTAVSYQILTGYGTQPRALSLGGHGTQYPPLDETVAFYFRNKNGKAAKPTDAVDVWVELRGAGPCGGKSGADVGNHTATFTVTSNGPRFVPANMDSSDPALDIETSALVPQTNFLDFFPQTTPNVAWSDDENAFVSICEYGMNGAGTGCAEWTKISADDILDVRVMNVHADVSTKSNPAITGRPTSRGCQAGVSGSSMGLHIKGAWTKIRFRQTVSGRSSCYSHLGHPRYNSHAAGNSDDLDTSVESVGGGYKQLYLGTSGLFEYDARAGDTMTDAVNMGDRYGEDAHADNAMECHGGAHMWNQEVEDTSKCSNRETTCTSCTIDKRAAQCNTGDRYATVTMRRKFKVYADGTKQFEEKAGPAIGVNCVHIATDQTATTWKWDNIEILI